MKNIKNILVFIIIIVVFIFTSSLILESSLIITTMKNSFTIWRDSIFPSLFPFFVLSDILISYGFVYFIGDLFRPIMERVFLIKKESSFVFILSIISGFPSSAKYTTTLLNDGIINEHEATKLLMFTHFSNPIFIISTISILFLNNKSVFLPILIAHYLGNIIIGLIYRKYYISNITTNTTTLNHSLNHLSKSLFHNKYSFGTILKNSISNAINTLLSLLGVISVFLVLTTIINEYFYLNAVTSSILGGILEITGGLRSLTYLDITLKMKVLLSTMFISFGGFSVHTQILSIISGTKIKYAPYFKARIIHMFISSLIILLIYDIFM